MRGLKTIVAAGLVIVAAGGGWLAAELSLPYRSYPGPSQFVDVPHGATTHEIAGLLASRGAVSNRYVFELLCRWHWREKLQAGEYLFDRPMTPREIFAKLAQGRIYSVTLAIPEGWTMFEIANLVAQEGLASRQAFLQAAANPAPVRDLAPEATNLEGFLFPAIYRFPRHVPAEAIAEAMVKRFRETWKELAPEGKLPPGMTVEGIVTLASLIERETPKAEERPVIADVFYNRLVRGYPLDCDPTVIYALERTGEYSGTLRPADLKLDSPYNTYLHQGLPPGPIANPGAASLRAALHPATVDYLYFVANGEGGHVFSKTLEEHDRNVARYRRLRSEAADAAAGPGKTIPNQKRHQARIRQ
jgi:peptidoglycan lytic transglycosylase G